MSAEHTTPCVIAPAATLDFARALVVALVPTPWNALPFTAPLSADGTEPATHWGMQSAATEQFAGLILAVQSDPTDATAAAADGLFDGLARIVEVLE